MQKTAEEINIMRDAGKILATILEELKNMVRDGLDVWELEKKFLSLCQLNKVVPACKNYTTSGLRPFPTGLCISVNDDGVHCYPKKGEVLKEGDTVLIDTVIGLKGLYVDSAITVGVGKIDDEAQRLLNTTYLAMMAGIKQAYAGNRIGDISNAIYTVVSMSGFDVLKDYSGHGIGRSMHEPPSVPCFGKAGTGEELLPGMTITVEPLVTQGEGAVIHKNKNDWETKTIDGKRFAQFEHTILITEGEPEILTKL